MTSRKSLSLTKSKTKTIKKAAHAFLLYTGYCEDQSISGWLLHHSKGFPSARAGLEHLAKVFLVMAVEDRAADEKHHWRKCPHCKKNLRATEEITADEITILVRECAEGCIDSLGSRYDVLEDNGWSLDSCPRNWLADLIVVYENADRLLGQLALGEKVDVSEDDEIFDLPRGMLSGF